VGDAPEGKVDIKSLAVESDGKNLIVNLEAANDLTQLFMKRDPGVVAVLQIDTDLNASTGGSPFFSEATGIEYHVDVQVCVKYKRGEISGTVCVGGISGTPERTGIISDISVGRYEGNGGANAKGVTVESREGTVAGETIKVIIPYGYIGVEPGRGIRILGALKEEWNPKTGKYPMLPEIKVRLK
jgi:hypothetical protein